MKEKITNEIHIEGKYSVVYALLEYIYIDEIKTHLNLELYPVLYNLANMYGLHRLMSICETYIFNNLKFTNAIQLFSLCFRFSIENLINKIALFILKDLGEHIHQQTIFQLSPAEYQQIIFYIPSHHKINL